MNEKMENSFRVNLKLLRGTNATSNSPNDISPLFSMLSLIVFGIEARLDVVVLVFFFFGFSTSTHRGWDLQRQQVNLKFPSQG